MKSIVILFADKNSVYINNKDFGGKSAFDLTKEWAAKAGEETFVIEEAMNMSSLLKQMSEIAEKAKADAVIYSYGDLPFINLSLTKTLLNNHSEYHAEYSYADGYPYGFSPEIIDAGALKIMAQLSDTTFKAQGEAAVSRSGIFDFMKGDINAWEIETVIAPEDWRLLRFSFDCGKKENFIACKELYKKDALGKTPEEVSDMAAKMPEVLKTVPGFYNIQITDTCTENCTYCPYCSEYEKLHKKSAQKTAECIDEKKFTKLIEEIADFSENAVISLSGWGDCGENPKLLDYVEKIVSYKGLSAFLEINGKYITEDFCAGIAKINAACPKSTNGYEKIMITVPLDAFTQKTYGLIHQTENSLETAVENTKKLAAALPGCVYPQFTRMTDNEAELEAFYRYWSDKNNGSGGKLTIQKYDSYQGLLEERLVADLSPLDRNVCWHLRRDITILTNGNVPLCKEYVLGGIIGNVFTDGLEAVWKRIDKTLIDHINENYSEKCGKCHEFYTFNF